MALLKKVALHTVLLGLFGLLALSTLVVPDCLRGGFGTLSSTLPQSITTTCSFFLEDLLGAQDAEARRGPRKPEVEIRALAQTESQT